MRVYSWQFTSQQNCSTHTIDELFIARGSSGIYCR
jgi:hypothetical protein